MSEHDQSKRQFIKAAAYVAPVILTLNAAPSLATVGSFADGGLGNGGGSYLGNAASSNLAKRPRQHRLPGLHSHRHPHRARHHRT